MTQTRFTQNTLRHAFLTATELKSALAAKDIEIAKLNSTSAQNAKERELAVIMAKNESQKIVQDKEKELTNLRNAVELEKTKGTA